MRHVITNPSPKYKFQESADNISKHRDMLQTRAFERALESAMAEYQFRLCEEEGDVNKSAASYLKLKGAHEFVKTLKFLAESPVVSVTNQIMNLDHTANR